MTPLCGPECASVLFGRVLTTLWTATSSPLLVLAFTCLFVTSIPGLVHQGISVARLPIGADMRQLQMYASKARHSKAARPWWRQKHEAPELRSKCRS